MANRQRPNQTVFYASEETQNILQEMESGGRSDFINKAIACYYERKQKGSIYLLETAYNYLKFVPSPEAQAVTKELRRILWRQRDRATSVMARVFKEDGSCSVDYFTDEEKAMILIMEEPSTVRYELYDQNNAIVAAANRNVDGSFSFTCLPPSAPSITF